MESNVQSLVLKTFPRAFCNVLTCLASAGQFPDSRNRLCSKFNLCVHLLRMPLLERIVFEGMLVFVHTLNFSQCAGSHLCDFFNKTFPHLLHYCYICEKTNL